jgi:hypothetical protein
MQDASIYSHLSDRSSLKVVEIGGGNSRALRSLPRISPRIMNAGISAKSKGRAGTCEHFSA